MITNCSKEVNQEETEMPDTHKGIHINERDHAMMPLHESRTEESESLLSPGDRTTVSGQSAW
jgi:hypothetical protein